MSVPSAAASRSGSSLENRESDMKNTVLGIMVAGSMVFWTAPSYAGEDCLGVSIGPGCIGIDADNGKHYRRVEVMPAHPRTYIVPNGGTYYYDDDTSCYEEGKRE